MGTKSNSVWVFIAVILSIFALLTCITSIASLAQLAQMIQESEPINWAGFIVSGLAFIAAIIYLLLGYNKENAIWYKLYIILCDVSLLIAMVSVMAMIILHPIITKALIPNIAIMFGFITTVGIAKNLGKKVAMILTGITMIIPILFIVAILIIIPSAFSGVIGTALLFALLRLFVLAFVLFVATKSKYVDKDIRGTV